MSKVDEVKTPELDRLSKVRDEVQALHEFLEEFLPTKRISLYQFQEGLTDLRTCSGHCSKCGNTGVYEVKIGDRDMPYGGSIQDLVYEYLGLDPKKIETERRALLEALQG